MTKKNTFSDSEEARHAVSVLLDLFMLTLTSKMADTFDWIRRGATSEQIAVILEISAATIRKRRERIIKKIREHFKEWDLEYRSFADYLDEQGGRNLRMGKSIDGPAEEYGMVFKKRQHPRLEGYGPHGGPYKTVSGTEISAIADDTVNIRTEDELDKYFDRE